MDHKPADTESNFTTTGTEEISMPTESENVDLQLKKLQAEMLTHQLAEIAAKKAYQKFTHEQVETALTSNNLAKKQREANCNHLKGGIDMQGLNGQGNGQFHAVIKHRMSNGDIHIMCQRCIKHWTPASPDYKTALNYVTDNSMSEGVQFSFRAA